MKKLLLIPFLLIGLNLLAQESAVFKIKYQPNHTYDGGITLNAACKVNLSGNDSIISKIKEKGITLPMGLNFNLKMNMSTKTAAAAADKSFPATMKFSFDDFSMELNGNKLPLPIEKLGQGASVDGRFDKDGIFQADSADGKGVSDSIKQKIKQMTSGFQKNIKFPDHPMKIGESFTQGFPFN